MIQMGRIKNFIEGTFGNYRNNKITLKQLAVRLCSYADTNIRSARLWSIFEDELNKQFDEEGNVAY